MLAYRPSTKGYAKIEMMHTSEGKPRVLGFGVFTHAVVFTLRTALQVDNAVLADMFVPV